MDERDLPLSVISGLNIPEPVTHPRDMRGDPIDALGIAGDRDRDVS